MDNSSKLNCKHREHQDYTAKAECRLFTNLTNFKTKFDPSICEYCIENQTNPQLNNEPFYSQYHKLLKNQNIKVVPSFEFANCILLGDPINSNETLYINDYIKEQQTCHYYGNCTITPQGHRNCQLCNERLRIKYEYNKNPNFNIYPKNNKYGQIKKWAVGITTSPRKYPTITKTIKALEGAGWNEGTIFAEPGEYGHNNQNWPYVYRHKNAGIFGNWMLGLYELFIRNIDADAFFMIQDDIVISPNTREYLENALWFSDEPHLVSLFGPNAIDKDENNGWRSTTEYHGGPNSIIMSHETVQEVLSSLTPLRYYGVQKLKNSSFDDLGIFALMHENNWNVYYPKPSIGDHIGHQSTHCQQTTKWVYSDRVLCNHQYYDVEHWFITDNRDRKDLYELRKNLDLFKPYKWLIIDQDFDYVDCLKNSCRSEWIITTKIDCDTRLISDIRDEIIKHFIYSHRWLKFGFGTINGEKVYTKNGPCRTLCEKAENLTTCLSQQLDHHDCRIIKGGTFWTC